ncbi:endolytic transglycosylase MltG [Thalassotalea atypica]|uniref:endolytic transglycosylase MltG n=1 Tax=Thalassotalea atypica TaxID=2054316 RepID=UPI002572DFE7|nr:endolytic transglycosylase MltG [Thalassotalea atypica]
MIKRLVVTLFALGAILVLSFYYLLNQKMNQRLPLTQPTLFSINAGESLNSLSKQLKTMAWIETRFWIRAFVRLNPKYSALKQGTYQINNYDTLKTLLQRLVDGDEHQFSITFVEGLTLKEWLVILNKQPYIIKTAETDSIANIVEYLGINQENPEGWFFPETYAYTAGTKDIELLQRAHRKMELVLTAAWQQKTQQLPYENAYQALIMASIIEKETGKTFEQGKIASVFVNRLNRKMRLQTDPTVIYGLGERFQGNITRAHLKEKTAYNTYRINGLPPTPIAMPGLSAITAALNPEYTDDFYFVSRGDGTHQFSSTLSQHNKAVAKYQLGKN